MRKKTTLGFLTAASILLSFFACSIFSSAQTEHRHCQDYMLFEGSENLVSFGMDTTRHWWALTSPFDGQYRLIVDNVETDVFTDINALTFSPDGNRWACFCESNNTQWYLLGIDTTILIKGNDVGEIQYSPNSKHIVYSYKESGEEYIVFKGDKIRTYNKTSKIYLSYNGARYAYVASRGDGYVIIVNGRESETFDEIKPFGFWMNGKILYAAKSGDLWSIYKGNQSLGGQYSKVTETAINLRGDAAAFLARLPSGFSVGTVISDEYYEPLEGEYYDQTSNLILHPTIPMIAYNAVYQGRDIVVFSGSEYEGGNDATSAPRYTFDGEELYFMGCDIDCFLSVNGREYSLNVSLPVDKKYAKKPGGRTIAYTTNTSLVIKDVEMDKLYAGMMVDRLSSPRYNWREGRYEALGAIRNRLYLMTCEF